MVTIRKVVNNIGISCFLLDQMHGVKISVDEFDFRIYSCDFGTFVTVSNKTCDLPIWVLLMDKVKEITSNVACGAGAGADKVRLRNRLDGCFLLTRRDSVPLHQLGGQSLCVI